MKPDLSVHVLTWNVKSGQCKCDLSQLLDISSLTNQSSDEQLADIYAIGLQEVAFKFGNIFFTEPWIETFDKLFKQLDYVRVKQIRLVGIVLMVYTKRSYLPRIKSVDVQFTRTGLGGLWGNKGGVSVSLNFGGVSLCLVNSHLAPHYENLDQRVADYNTIIDGQNFYNTKKPNILSHDYVIWIGDLNFRIDNLSGDEIHDIIMYANKHPDNDLRFEKLLANDQLNRVRREGRAFSEFNESNISFAPTYKFFVNTDDYEYKARKPAFTDRVLYRYTSNAYEDFELKLRQLYYKSHPQYKQSDHKPVSALFHLTTKASAHKISKRYASLALSGEEQALDGVPEDKEEEIFVTFHTISNWKINNESIAWYTISPNDEKTIASLSQWDWIGLFKADFISIEDYLLFVWANTEPNRWSAPNFNQTNVQQLDNSEDSTDTIASTRRQPWFSVQYPDNSLLIADKFRLVYVTQSGDVLGISDPFDIID
ncbi:inositol polyphosphate 5-phosphatase K-like isoform X2 [Oppia nitens]|nr:inositol polyphosphate 5-phosphatase K-like isoform X2 [Oppia nitens]